MGNVSFLQSEFLTGLPNFHTDFRLAKMCTVLDYLIALILVCSVCENTVSDEYGKCFFGQVTDVHKSVYTCLAKYSTTWMQD